MADSKEVRSSFKVFSSIFANLDPPLVAFAWVVPLQKEHDEYEANSAR